MLSGSLKKGVISTFSLPAFLPTDSHLSEILNLLLLRTKIKKVFLLVEFTMLKMNVYSDYVMYLHLCTKAQHR